MGANGPGANRLSLRGQSSDYHSDYLQDTAIFATKFLNVSKSVSLMELLQISESFQLDRENREFVNRN